MSITIGSNTYNISEAFKEKLQETLKDKQISSGELEALKASVSGVDDEKALAILENLTDNAKISIDLNDTDNIEATEFTFKVASREELKEHEEGFDPTHAVFKFGEKIGGKLAHTEAHVASHIAGAIADTIAEPILKEEENLRAVFGNKIPEGQLEDIKAFLGEAKFTDLVEDLKKLPTETSKNLVIDKLNSVLSDTKIPVTEKKQIVQTIQEQSSKLLENRQEYSKQLKELESKYAPDIEKGRALENKIVDIEKLLDPAKPNAGLNAQLKAYKAELKDLTGRTEIRTALSLDKTLGETDELRFKHILDATTDKFGPPYQGIAQKVDDAIKGIKDTNGNQVFKNPEAVNLAIRKRPSDLTPVEKDALKQLRETISKVPEDGLVVAKVSFPGEAPDLQKFVIEPEYLKNVKSEEELVDLLKLDFPGSKFVKVENGVKVPNFKLADVQVTVGRVFPDEATAPFSLEFGGKRSGVIYQYPFSGSGFTTPEKGFPTPEIDLGTTPIKETKTVAFGEFVAKNPVELAPSRPFKALESVVGKDSAKAFQETFEKIPSEDVKKLLSAKINEIISDPALSATKKTELLKGLETHTNDFIKESAKYDTEIKALEAKYKPELDKVNELREKVKSIEAQIKKAPSPELEVQLKAYKAELDPLEKRLSGLTGETDITRKYNAYKNTVAQTGEIRFNDIIQATNAKFGPPYEGVAKKVDDLLGNIKDAKGNQVFKSPEEVNLAIRKSVDDLTDAQKTALAQIRKELTKIPEEGLDVAKVTLKGKGGKVTGFVIEADYLKGIKTPQELADKLRLNYPNSEFFENGKVAFTLDDIEISVGKVFDGEVEIPFNKALGGTRDNVIYEYPFSGKGFLTSEKGFPIPELDVGKKGIEAKFTKKVTFNEFQEKPISEISPKREKPVVEAKPKAEEVRPTQESKVETKPKAEEIKNPEVQGNETKPKVEEIKNPETPKVEVKPPDAPKVETPIAAIQKTALEQADELPIDDVSKKALKELLEKPEVKADALAVEKLLKTAKDSAGDNKVLQAVLQSFKETDPKILAKTIKEGETGGQIIELARKLIPAFEKLGVPAVDVIKKVAKGLGKALPVIGGVASAYDAARMTSIALKGRDLNGTDFTKYPDGDPRNTPENLEKLKDLRALALVGAAANGLDTILAVIEATGVGNIDLPVQLGLAGAEILIDVAIEHFREHPEDLPKELSLGIKATALGLALVPPAGTLAVAQIYGLDGTIGIANELTKLAGETSIQGIKALGDLHAKALDQGLSGVAKGINGLADVVKNPEKYAEALGKTVDEVVTQAVTELKQLATKGGEAVYSTLLDIASNPAKYGKKAADLAVSVGNSVAEGTKAAYDFTKALIIKGAIKFEEGLEHLNKLGAKGIEFGKTLIKEAISSTKALGQKFSAFVEDVYKNPAKYAELGAQALTSLKNAVAGGLSTAFDKLEHLAQKGIASARNTLNNVVEASIRAGKATTEYLKYVIDNPTEAGQKLLETTKNFLVSAANNVNSGVNNALAYLEDLQTRTKGALGNFKDTLVDLAKQGGHAAKEIFQKHFDVIKNRLPEILDATRNLGNAVLDKLVSSVPSAKLVQALISNGVSGFKNLINITSKYANIAKEFVAQIGRELYTAYERSSIPTNLKPIKDVIGKYYDQAVSIGGEVAIQARKLLYEAAQNLDEKADDWIPDVTYSWIKP